jgi:hypothetical protein
MANRSVCGYMAVCGTCALKQWEGPRNSAAGNNQYNIIATVALNREGFSYCPVTKNMGTALAGVSKMKEGS